MAYESAKVSEIVERAVRHSWSIPEFQRGFVWKATQVRDLAESLWLDYPIGNLLLWDSSAHTEPRTVLDAKTPSLWVVDGQQRTTALAIAFGRKPYWWSEGEEWNKILKKYDIRFDIDTREPPYFKVADAVIRRATTPRYVSLRELLVLDTDREDDQQKLQDLAKDIKLAGLCDGMDAMEVYTRLDRVRKIREKDVVLVTIDHELEDVVEVFARLNSRGTRVTEADIYLGIVAARSPGWVRSTFLPYLSDLAEAGFDISPNLLFRSVTAVGAKRVRFKEIPDEFWNEGRIRPAWNKAQTAWKQLIARFKDYGILSNNPMPSETALVTMVAMVDKFPKSKFAPLMHWFLQASRFGRYSGSSSTSLEEDLRDIQESETADGCLSKLLKRFPHDQPLTAEDFLRDYGDSRFGRFILYLLAYRNGAQDWDETGNRLGFEGVNLLADFRPQWHHIFPRKFLSDSIKADEIDALANIAVIGPSINIRISAKNPLDYIKRYRITDEKLRQQFVDEDVESMTIANYRPWLDRRAQRLSEAGNEYLSSLVQGVGVA